MKFLADEGVDKPIVDQLRTSGALTLIMFWKHIKAAMTILFYNLLMMKIGFYLLKIKTLEN